MRKIIKRKANNMEEKYYTRSNGESVKISELETTHLINSLSKCYREIFNAKSNEEFNEKLSTINNLKEDLHRRINIFQDGINGEQ